MPLFDIESYRTRFLGGARSYLFFVLFTIPDQTGTQNDGIIGSLKSTLATFGLGADQDKLPYLVRSTNLPEFGIDQVVTPYSTYDLKTAGLPIYSDWSVSMHIDEQGEVLNKFDNWRLLCINGLPANYMRDQEIHLLDYSGSSMLSYKLYGAWPKSIGAVSLDYSSNDVATVDISFTYQFLEVSKVNAQKSSMVKQGVSRLAGFIK